MSEDMLANTAPPARHRLLHPLSAALILGLDWLLFGASTLSLGLSTPLSVVLGFMLGAFGVLTIQRRMAQDSHAVALLKGLLAGIAVGLPLPLGGTLLGGWLLSLAGFDWFRQRLLRA